MPGSSRSHVEAASAKKCQDGRIQESKCGDPFPLCSDNVDVIDVLRCLNCDALFERGRFVLFWGEVRADQLK